MPITGLDHINIRVDDVLATLNFYRDVFGMAATGMTQAEPNADGGWLRDASGDPVIHVGSTAAAYPNDDKHPRVAAVGSGAVHHIAFNCTDHDAMAERLTTLGILWTESAFPAFDLVQMFVADPNGILLELNFRGL